MEIDMSTEMSMSMEVTLEDAFNARFATSLTLEDVDDTDVLLTNPDVGGSSFMEWESSHAVRPEEVHQRQSDGMDIDFKAGTSMLEGELNNAMLVPARAPSGRRRGRPGASSRRCSVCGIAQAIAMFSRHQWKQRNGVSKCKRCANIALYIRYGYITHHV